MRVYTENDSYEFRMEPYTGWWSVNENDSGWRGLEQFPEINIGLPMRLRLQGRGLQMTEDVIDIEHADD